MSIYIHIPFCTTICSYCDFCKRIYDKKYVDKYLLELKNEIESNYKEEVVKTIYIGGGTPTSLDLEQLNKLLTITNILNKDKNYEFTIECNVDSLDEEKIRLFNKYGINRVSIGIESFDKNNLSFLNRTCNYKEVKEKIKLLNKYSINNINVDLIYAIPCETLKVLKKDLELISKLKIKHVSTYSLIIEDNTCLKIKGIKNIDEELDYKMYNLICSYLKKHGFVHYEISNFAKKWYFSKHNLTYWNNNEYYGFGLGASGYINNVRYSNTRSLTNYLKGCYRLEEENMTKVTNKENELMLGLRKIKGVNKKEFYNKYNEKLEEKEIIKKLLKEGKLKQNKEYIYINKKYIYTSNNILVDIIGEI